MIFKNFVTGTEICNKTRRDVCNTYLSTIYITHCLEHILSSKSICKELSNIDICYNVFNITNLLLSLLMYR